MQKQEAYELSWLHESLDVKEGSDNRWLLVCSACIQRKRSSSRANKGVFTTARTATAHVATCPPKKKAKKTRGHSGDTCTPGGSEPPLPIPVDTQGGEAGGSMWPEPGTWSDFQNARRLDDTLAEARLGHGVGGHGTCDPLPVTTTTSDDNSQWGVSESEQASRGVLVDSDDGGHASDASSDGPDDPGLPRGGPYPEPAATKTPRKGSGADLHARRLQPIAKGHRRSVLQAAYSLVEVKKHGASNVVLDKVAMNEYLMLNDFVDPDHVTDVHFPKSLHLVKAVLGTEDASQYEFGCCPKCAWRYEPDQQRAHKSKAVLLQETCPQCASPKYQVHPNS